MTVCAHSQRERDANVLCHACAVRVMDCDGEGAMSDIVTGLEWILENLELPAVVLMSIGGDATLLLDQACEALVTAGATVVVAAGNDDEGMGPSMRSTKLSASCLEFWR